jgi:hypothetical protein
MYRRNLLIAFSVPKIEATDVSETLVTICLTTQSHSPTLKMEAVNFSEMLVTIYESEEYYIFNPEDEGSRCNRIVNNDLPEKTASLSSTLNMEAADFSETLLTIG